MIKERKRVEYDDVDLYLHQGQSMHQLPDPGYNGDRPNDIHSDKDDNCNSAGQTSHFSDRFR